MDLGLAGKKAIIVGGARGIGFATAEVLAREGCDVAITARGEDSVKDAIASLKRYDTKVIGGAVNVRKEDEYKAWLARTIDELDGCDILVPITSAGGGAGSARSGGENSQDSESSSFNPENDEVVTTRGLSSSPLPP